MNENELDALGYNRRDFLKGSSVATLMTMLGGVELFAQPAAPAAAEGKSAMATVKVAVIGLGGWGREILRTLPTLTYKVPSTQEVMPLAEVAAICDTYPAALKRAATEAPKAAQTGDYKTILANKDIRSVIVATPTHQHKEIVLAALAAGKHVYCEAPLANTIEDAREIAKAAKDARQLVFQAGLQLRSEPQRHFLVPFIRSGALGQFVLARGQWHKKTSWRTAAPNAEREKAVNWRLDKDVSLGLAGEVGCHQLDQANWFFNSRPKAITGFGGVLLYTEDERQVPDTIQLVMEYPAGMNLVYDATLANSFDAAYDVYYGSYSAVMVRENKAWLFKEVDSPLLGWEVYARKEKFYDETGIALIANASKSVQAPPAEAAKGPVVDTTLSSAFENFLRNSREVDAATEDYISLYGADDKDGLKTEIAKMQKTLRPAASYLEGYQATVTAIKANEAVVTRKRVEIKKDLYELG
jgi:predicted dehydrogenase